MSVGYDQKGGVFRLFFCVSITIVKEMKWFPFFLSSGDATRFSPVPASTRHLDVLALRITVYSLYITQYVVCGGAVVNELSYISIMLSCLYKVQNKIISMCIQELSIVGSISQR